MTLPSKAWARSTTVLKTPYQGSSNSDAFGRFAESISSIRWSNPTIEPLIPPGMLPIGSRSRSSRGSAGLFAGFRVKGGARIDQFWGGGAEQN
jgi:hypothetical protein